MFKISDAGVDDHQNRDSAQQSEGNPAACRKFQAETIREKRADYSNDGEIKRNFAHRRALARATTMLTGRLPGYITGAYSNMIEAAVVMPMSLAKMALTILTMPMPP